MSINACAAPDALVDVPFSLRRPGARSVFVAFFLNQSLNEPAPRAMHPVSRDDDGPGIATDLLPLARTGSGYWRVEVPLLPGWYEYAFLVDGEWVLDPAAPEICPDGAGGHNSARTVVRIARRIRFPSAPAARARRRTGELRRAG